MSRLPGPVVGQLELLAGEVFENFAAEGYTISEALSKHEAFRREGRRSRSSLTRDLLTHAARIGASRGLAAHP